MPSNTSLPGDADRGAGNPSAVRAEEGDEPVEELAEDAKQAKKKIDEAVDEGAEPGDDAEKTGGDAVGRS